MKSKYFLRVLSLLALLVSLLPARNIGALSLADSSPAGMFQLPWDLGTAWVAIDGIDNGTRRPLNSSHHWSVGGAIDFAPHNNMRVGEDTSRFWVTAAASGTVVATSFCHVRIDHGNGWTTEYQFLANISVKVGDSVSRNQRLGIIADGIRYTFCPGSHEPNVPHVHFILRPSLRNATLAGWEINYLPVLNKTTFRKNDQTFGLFKPLLNTFDQVQIVLRGPITWDTLHSGSIDAFRHERWSLTLDDLTKFTLTATTATSGLTPLILLLDANGNEITRSPGTVTSTQPPGNYFVQIQPQAGSGSYTLLAQKDDLPLGSFVSTIVNPVNVNVSQTAIATVRLNNVPAEGYASTEFTCTYNSTLATVSNIVVADLFGEDPAVATSDSQDGSFIVAVAGSKGKKATADGIAFTFSLTGSQAGQTAVECKARVSQGNNVLTVIDFVPGSLTILGSTSTPTAGASPTAPFESPVPIATQTPSPAPGTPTDPGSTDTPSPTPSITPDGTTATTVPVTESATPTLTASPTIPAGNWLTLTNLTYGFRFMYPQESQIVPGGNDNSTRINLPFVAGTNLSEKYLQMIVVENANPCRSPLASSSIPQTSETVVINGITFLKETGEDGTAGHINKWTAYSTMRGNACVSLDFVLRAANPSVFTTPPPLYDETGESIVFGQIVTTYQWLAGTSTSTPTPGGFETPTSSTPVQTVTPTLSTPVGSPTPTGLPEGLVTGKVIASKPVTVGIYNASDVLVTSATANLDGTFSLTAPAGTYTITASASGYLDAEGSVTITGGSTSTKPTISLLAGEIDGNGVIDQFDALTIGMGYNSATPSEADLNNDGVINVLDLELLASNYRKAGPQDWN